MTSLLVLARSDNAGDSSIDGDVKAHFIPTQIGNLVSLTRLELDSNAPGGTIPTELARLEMLEYFVCSNKLRHRDDPRPNWGAYGD
jgi:hypothetical protein